jgi:hypothetical protein
MIKILGAADILCALLLILLGINVEVPWILIFIAGAYLLLKLLIFIFSFNLASAFDLFACFCLFLTLFFEIPSFLLITAAILVGQKGFFSLVA